jgi:hypothetical protein
MVKCPIIAYHDYRWDMSACGIIINMQYGFRCSECRHVEMHNVQTDTMLARLRDYHCVRFQLKYVWNAMRGHTD